MLAGIGPGAADADLPGHVLHETAGWRAPGAEAFECVVDVGRALEQAPEHDRVLDGHGPALPHERGARVRRVADEQHPAPVPGRGHQDLLYRGVEQFGLRAEFVEEGRGRPAEDGEARGHQRGPVLARVPGVGRFDHGAEQVQLLRRDRHDAQAQAGRHHHDLVAQGRGPAMDAAPDAEAAVAGLDLRPEQLPHARADPVGAEQQVGVDLAPVGQRSPHAVLPRLHRLHRAAQGHRHPQLRQPGRQHPVHLGAADPQDRHHVQTRKAPRVDGLEQRGAIGLQVEVAPVADREAGGDHRLHHAQRVEVRQPIAVDEDARALEPPRGLLLDQGHGPAGAGQRDRRAAAGDAGAADQDLFLHPCSAQVRPVRPLLVGE